MKNTYKICPQFLSPCSKPVIEWISNPGLTQPCDDGSNCIEVSIDPNSDEHCLEFLVFCDDCDSCPPQYFKVCFCDNPGTQIDNCTKCNDEGVIVKTCTDEDLAAGKQCTPDGCNCPATKPLFDPILKKCVECLAGTKNPTNPCLECINGSWVTKICIDGICDVKTGDCIPDCTLATDGRTKYNPITKTCECELGFIFNGTECVPKPPDCGPGTVLNPVTNECEPIGCPPGYKYSIELDDCVIDCSGNPCANGLECTGINCGCHPVDLICVDCIKFPDALGCKVSPCENKPCDGSPGSCGPGCTCVNGECVSCDNFPCDTCSSHDGCGCKDGVNCEGDPSNSKCDDKLTLTKDGCDITAKLAKTTICQCEGISSGVKLTDFKVNTVSAPFMKQTWLANFLVDIKKGMASSIGAHELLPLFTNTVIHNELPTNGNVTIKVTNKYKKINTGEIIEDPTPNVITKSFINLSEVEFKDVVVGSFTPTTHLLVGSKYEITITDLEFANNCKYASTVVFSSDKYEATPKVGEYFGFNKLISSSSKNPLFTWKRDGSVFRKLYKVAGSIGTYIDTLFGPKKFSNLTRGQQTLTNPLGELLPNTTYEISSDCNCDTPKVIKTVVCDVKFDKDTHFTVSTTSDATVCNNKIEITNDFPVCPLNQDLKFFGWTGVDLAKQTKYILSVNGKDVATFVYKNTSDTQGELKLESTSQSFIGYQKIFTDEIKSVSLRMNHDNTCVTESTISAEICDPTITGTCNTSGTVDFTFVPSCTKLQSVEYDDIAYSFTRSGNGSVTVPEVPPRTDAVFTVIFENGCRKKYTASKDCCAADTLIVDVLQPLFTGRTMLSVKTSNSQTISSIVVNNTEVAFTESTTEPKVYIVDIPTPTNSTIYTVKATTTVGCEYSKTTQVTPASNSSVDMDPEIICANGVSTLYVRSNSPNTVFTVVTPSGNTLTGTTNNVGVGTLTNLNVAGNYILTSFNNAATNITTTLSQIASLQVTNLGLTSQGPFCVGDVVGFTLTATPNSVVTVVSNSITKHVNINSLGFGNDNFIYNSVGSYGITATSIATSTNTCSNPQNLTVSAVVAAKPVINDLLTECILPLTATSDITLKAVCNAPNLTVSAVVSGVTYTLTAGSPSNIYQVVIPQGSGKSITVTATNGVCTDTRTEVAQTCNCAPVLMPNPQSNMLACNGTLLVQFPQQSGLELQWFDMDNGNVEMLPNEWSKSLIPGTYEVSHKDLITGCESQRVQFIIIDGDITVNLNTTNSSPCTEENTTITSTLTGNNLTNITYKWYVNNVIQPTTSSSFIFNSNLTTASTVKLVVQRGTTACIAQDTITITPQICCSPFTVLVDTNCMIGSVQGANVGDLFDYVWQTTGNVILQTDLQVHTSTFTNPTSLPQGSQVKLVVYKTATCTSTTQAVINPPIKTVSVSHNIANVPIASVINGNANFLITSVTGYNCTTSSGTVILPTPASGQLYAQSYVFKSSPCVTSTKTSTDLITDINNWFVANGKSATISLLEPFPSMNKEFTYSVVDTTNEFEMIDITYSIPINQGSPCNGANFGTIRLKLDFPCEC